MGTSFNVPEGCLRFVTRAAASARAPVGVVRPGGLHLLHQLGAGGGAAVWAVHDEAAVVHRKPARYGLRSGSGSGLGLRLGLGLGLKLGLGRAHGWFWLATDGVP